MSDLVLHTGALSATLSQVMAVPTPPSTSTHYPLAHGDVIDAVIEATLNAGIKVDLDRARWGLGGDGQRLFGVAPVSLAAGSDWEFTLGIRNSHDKTFPVGLTVGTRVFVCDNLAFNGEVTSRRKHTRFVGRDLPRLVSGLVARWQPLAEHQRSNVEALKGIALSPLESDALVTAALRRDCIGLRQVKPLIEELKEPKHGFDPTTAWGWWNCATEVLKTSSDESLLRQNLNLTALVNDIIEHHTN